jgi:hypothetical protein
MGEKVIAEKAMHAMRYLKRFWPVVMLLIIMLVILWGWLYLYSPYSYYLLTKARAISKQEGLFLYHWGILQRVTQPNVYPINMSWSPDGDSIALNYSFDEYRFEPEQYIGILDIKTHNLTPALKIDKANIYNGENLTGTDKRQRVDFAWSPNGKQILFNMLSPDHDQQIYLLDVETQEISATSLRFTESASKRNYVFGISWAPGPFPVLTVCFDSTDARETCNLYSVNTEFNALTLLTNDIILGDAMWLSDGKTIVFSCYANKTPLQTGSCLYSLNDNQVNVITKEFVRADWTPDGQFAFSLDGGGGEGEPSYFVGYNLKLDKIDRLPSIFFPDGGNIGVFAP